MRCSQRWQGYLTDDRQMGIAIGISIASSLPHHTCKIELRRASFFFPAMSSSSPHLTLSQDRSLQMAGLGGKGAKRRHTRRPRGRSLLAGSASLEVFVLAAWRVGDPEPASLACWERERLTRAERVCQPLL